MKAMKTAGMWVMVGMMALALTSCAKPPVAEKTAAQTAQQAAMAAQADTYAAGAMTSAKQAWDDAEAKMTAKAYKEAKPAYVAAQAAYEKAVSEVEAGKKAMIQENQTLLTALEAKAADLNKLFAQKGKKLSADIKKGMEADIKFVQDAITKTKDTMMNAPAEARKIAEEASALADKHIADLKK
jgi:hypothetical protein